MIELKISCFNTMLNYRFSQKLKLLGYNKFNHLTNTSNKYMPKSKTQANTLKLWVSFKNIEFS